MTKRRLLPSKWYCKYCYGTHPIDWGPDGSIVICLNCGAGLAPTEDVIEAGSLRSFYERIEADFAELCNTGVYPQRQGSNIFLDYVRVGPPRRIELRRR